ncbi:MAG: hypothetical protein COU27_01515 [Candidatus Levybacteria bacterium CG10_big_fil_rev_8_21_14_0_10_36_7]|nr:MAG: hypothetical protein COU27_01515 [Candidatus Levybacteria bacterium CG10_big_fil_rev_8_21_14_0_10_36_7]
MKILMITGDKNLFIAGTPPNNRLEIQKRYVDIVPVFWGRGSLFDAFKEEGNFDVITVQDPFWRGLVGLFVSIYKKTRFNVQVHTDLISQNLARRIISWIVLRNADSVRVVSAKLKTQIEKLGVKAPIKILPIFLDIKHFKSFSRNENLKEEKTVLWIGRFEKEKNPSLAVSILKEVLSSGIKANLVMLGEGSLENSLKNDAKGLPVIFHGWQDPAPFLVSADVLINTSYYEGYGASIVEALVAGVPVVAPDVGVAKEAGAVIAKRNNLANSVVEVLRSGKRGEIKIPILSEKEWGLFWSETL